MKPPAAKATPAATSTPIHRPHGVTLSRLVTAPIPLTNLIDKNANPLRAMIINMKTPGVRNLFLIGHGIICFLLSHHEALKYFLHHFLRCVVL